MLTQRPSSEGKKETPKRKVVKILSLVMLSGLLLFVLIGFSTMRTRQTDGYLYLVDKYHQVQKAVLKVKYIFDSHNYGIGKPKIITKSQVSLMDGMTMIYIPEGDFLMGSNKSESRIAPAHIVYLDSFWVDQTEVTNEMYVRCVDQGNCAAPIQIEEINPYYNNSQYVNYPVVYVSWYDAETYCNWAGRRLPTEAEWEKAARGTEGNLYPWGNEALNPKVLNYQNNIGEPLPVDQYSLGASPYGVLNMAGNVREWVSDWFDKKYYESELALVNPTGPSDGTKKSLRGGGFKDEYVQFFTYKRLQHAPYSPGIDRGFRCAADADK